MEECKESSSSRSDGDACIVCCRKNICPTCRQEWNEVTRTKNKPFSCPACRSKFPESSGNEEGDDEGDEEDPSSSSPPPNQSSKKKPKYPYAYVYTMNRIILTIILVILFIISMCSPEAFCNIDHLQELLLSGIIIHLSTIPNPFRDVFLKKCPWFVFFLEILGFVWYFLSTAACDRHRKLYGTCGGFRASFVILLTLDPPIRIISFCVAYDLSN